MHIISAKEFERSLDDSFDAAASVCGLQTKIAKRAVRYEEQLVHKMFLELQEWPHGYRLTAAQLIPILGNIDTWAGELAAKIDNFALPYGQVADNFMLAIACTPAPRHIVHWQAQINANTDFVVKKLEKHLPQLYVHSYNEQDLRSRSRLMIAADLVTYVECMRLAMQNLKEYAMPNLV